MSKGSNELLYFRYAKNILNKYLHEAAFCIESSSVENYNYSVRELFVCFDR